MGKFESELLGITLVTSHHNENGLKVLSIDGPDDTVLLACDEHALRELRRELTKDEQ